MAGRVSHPQKSAQSLSDLIRESQYLRDHLRRVQGLDSLTLGSALHPFEQVEDPSSVPEAAVSALAAAFQDAYDKATLHIDTYTLGEVLAGASPHRRRASIWYSSILTACGILLVVAALHFSYWASRTSHLLAEADRFTDFDHFASMMKLVEFRNYFEKNGEPGDLGDLEPQLVYLEGFSALQVHYMQENNLANDMRKRYVEFSPLRAYIDTKRRAVCKSRAADPVDAGLMDRIVAAVINCPRSQMMATAGVLPADRIENIQPTAAGGPDIAKKSPFVSQLSNVQQLEQETMLAAGRDRKVSYEASQREIRNWSDTLRELTSIVNRWALPIIYGALGSIVYCMWRVLSPNIAALGLLYSIMRTAFAALAALTLSMLLIPSNVLGVGTEINSPLVYLLSFIFGYSIEAFVSTLNTLNRYAQKSMAPKDRPAEG